MKSAPCEGKPVFNTLECHCLIGWLWTLIIDYIQYEEVGAFFGADVSGVCGYTILILMVHSNSNKNVIHNNNNNNENILSAGIQ